MEVAQCCEAYQHRGSNFAVVAQLQRAERSSTANSASTMAKGKPVSCSLKPAKLVALLGLVLVLSGIGFGYLAFDAGVRAASGSSGGWQDAMLAATGTQQMVSATICVSIGARRRSAQAAARACPPRRALTPRTLRAAPQASSCGRSASTSR